MLQVVLSILMLGIVQAPVDTAGVVAGDPPPAAVETQNRVAIQLDFSGDDPVGTLFADKLRAALEGSPRFYLTNDNSKRRLIIVVQHVDRDCRERNVSTVYSVIWTHNPGEIYFARYLTATVGFTPIDGIDQAVAGLVLETESLVERLGLE